MPAFIIFEKTSPHVGKKDQDYGMPPCHGVHSRANRHHWSMVYQRCQVTTMVAQRHLSHWRWNFHASTNEVPSLIIKTTGISLTNKEEQLSTILLEDKDNQGGTRVCISNEHQLVDQKATKIKKGWWKKNMQLSTSSSPGSDGARKI